MNDKRDGIEFFLGAIFDTGDTLSRQAFEYAVAKINAQSQIFKQSKIVVTQIDLVDAHDSFFAYKLGNSSLFFSLLRSPNLLFSSIFSLCPIKKRHCCAIYWPIDSCP